MNYLDRIAYDTGGYTVQEILSSFCKKILEIIDLVNKNEEVCDEVRTIIETIRNEVVPPLVEDIMKELQDSGYFDSLVNVTLIEQLRTELTALLNDTITDYTTKIQKVNNAYRSFKPMFGHCVDWSSYSSNTNWSEEKIKTEIDSLVNYGVEKLSVTIQTRCVNGTVSLVSDLERFKKCLDYAKEKGLETTTIKVHCNQFRKAIESNEYDNENLKEQWLNILNDIGEYFKSYCEYFVVINEGENLFSNSNNEEFLLKCLEVGKSKGFKSGFTPSSSDGWDKLPELVKRLCDFIAFNCYPIISLKGLKTSYEDVVNAFEVYGLNNWIDTHKKKYNKPIIISEIGCEDRKSCLACTYVWDFGNGENYNDGKVQNIMLKGIFEYLKDNDNLDGIYYWFPFRGANVVNTINYYVGGKYNE